MVIFHFPTQHPNSHKYININKFSQKLLCQESNPVHTLGKKASVWPKVDPDGLLVLVRPKAQIMLCVCDIMLVVLIGTRDVGISLSGPIPYLLYLKHESSH